MNLLLEGRGGCRLQWSYESTWRKANERIPLLLEIENEDVHGCPFFGPFLVFNTQSFYSRSSLWCPSTPLHCNQVSLTLSNSALRFAFYCYVSISLILNRLMLIWICFFIFYFLELEVDSLYRRERKEAETIVLDFSAYFDPLYWIV